MTEQKANTERLTKWLHNKKAICYKVCEKECVDGNEECYKCEPFKDAMVRLAEYEDLGTVAELKEAREKQVAKKPKVQETTEKKVYRCPCCDGFLMEMNRDYLYGGVTQYCERCGQRLGEEGGISD